MCVCVRASVYECYRGCQTGWHEGVEGLKKNELAFQETRAPYALLTGACVFVGGGLQKAEKVRVRLR